MTGHGNTGCSGQMSAVISENTMNFRQYFSSFASPVERPVTSAVGMPIIGGVIFQSQIQGKFASGNTLPRAKAVSFLWLTG